MNPKNSLVFYENIQGQPTSEEAFIYSGKTNVLQITLRFLDGRVFYFRNYFRGENFREIS